jgi:hypothetical protein
MVDRILQDAQYPQTKCKHHGAIKTTGAQR